MKKEELNNIDSHKVLLVDIREKEELDSLPSLPNSTHIPMGEIIREAEDGRLPKDKLIVTICRSGGRCSIVNHELAALGYQVDLLEGGLMN
jgi:rhodanese-related sulfurtransferase